MLKTTPATERLCERDDECDDRPKDIRKTFKSEQAACVAFAAPACLRVFVNTRDGESERPESFWVAEVASILRMEGDSPPAQFHDIRAS